MFTWTNVYWIEQRQNEFLREAEADRLVQGTRPGAAPGQAAYRRVITAIRHRLAVLDKGAMQTETQSSAAASLL